MPYRHAGTATLHQAAPFIDALAGAPIAEPEPALGEREKGARKRRKRELQRLRDAERPPGAFERFKVLAELVKQGNQIIDLVDHRARYALVVLGALNAGVVLILSRLQVLSTLAPDTRMWFIAAMGVYAALTSVCVYFAVECLRPRRMYEAGVGTERVADAGPAARHASRGILFWETIAAYELDEYRQAWSAIRMEQLNAEVVSLAHRQSRVVRAKYAVLGRLFNGLVLLLVLAGVLLATGALLGIVR